MWQRFTERARRSVFYAQEEAQRLRTGTVDANTLMIGILKVKDPDVIRILEPMGLDLNWVEDEVRAAVQPGNVEGQDVILSDDAKKVIDLAYTEARQFNRDYVGIDHLLLGIIQEGNSAAAGSLLSRGVTLERVRREIDVSSSGNGIAGKDHTLNTVNDIKSINTLRGRSLTRITDLSSDEVKLLLDAADLLKRTIKEDPTAHQSILPGRTLAMIFEKPSLRTRVTFETGMTQLGGHAIYLAPSDIQLGVRESIPDVARNISRWCSAIMARVFAHSTIVGLAENASIPVINALCDLEHPCQALADFQAIREHKGDLKGLKLAFIGDGNNVANSLMLFAAKVGTNFAIACPKGYEPLEEVVNTARELAKESGATIEVVNDPFEAVAGADALYTDVWASMGQEAERAERARVFAPYQVNAELVAAAKSDAIVLHCLPAHRGEEITDEVLDGPQSVVLDEAENRLHAQKAVLALTVG
jgi:ornithine carbamoyltransferase